MSETKIEAYVMPDGTPAPSLMTPEEACRFLRIRFEKQGPDRGLRNLRYKFGLPAVRVGKRLRYQPEKLIEWVESRSN